MREKERERESRLRWTPTRYLRMNQHGKRETERPGRKVAENEQDSSGVASDRARFMNFTLSLLRDYCKKGCTGESN